VPQVWLEKSSVKVERDERVFEFSFDSELVFLFALVLVLVFVFRFARRFELPLLLLLLVMLAMAKIRMTTPIPMNTSTAPMPSSHGQTLRFCGAAGGIGLHGGAGGRATGCCGGGGGAGACPGYAIVGCGDVSRADGYCTVAPGSNDEGAAVLSRGEPSSRQKLRASSEYVRLHWGQRFICKPRFVLDSEPRS